MLSVSHEMQDAVLFDVLSSDHLLVESLLRCLLLHLFVRWISNGLVFLHQCVVAQLAIRCENHSFDYYLALEWD